MPHLIVLPLLYQLAYLLSIVAWLSILLSGRCDRTIWNVALYVLRWTARLATYLALLRDEFPPFGDKPYPAEFTVPFPQRRSRLTVAFRPVLVIPQLFVLYFFYLPLLAGIIIAWFTILITGRYPEGIWRLVAGMLRWILRVLAYQMLILDTYPPFSLGLNGEPGESASDDEAVQFSPFPVRPPQPQV